MSLATSDFSKDMQLFSALDVNAVEKILRYSDKVKEEMKKVD
jgi:hypothetical protein